MVAAIRELAKQNSYYRHRVWVLLLLRFRYGRHQFICAYIPIYDAGVRDQMRASRVILFCFNSDTLCCLLCVKATTMCSRSSCICIVTCILVKRAIVFGLVTSDDSAKNPQFAICTAVQLFGRGRLWRSISQ